MVAYNYLHSRVLDSYTDRLCMRILDNGYMDHNFNRDVDRNLYGDVDGDMHNHVDRDLDSNHDYYRAMDPSNNYRNWPVVEYNN